ncbi:unnamed protein product, partial [Ectocarpus sp. 8 AP-2014]
RRSRGPVRRWTACALEATAGLPPQPRTRRRCCRCRSCSRSCRTPGRWRRHTPTGRQHHDHPRRPHDHRRCVSWKFLRFLPRPTHQQPRQSQWQGAPWNTRLCYRCGYQTHRETS